MISLHIAQDLKETLLPTLTSKGITGVVIFDEKDELFKTGEKYHITLFSNGGTRAEGRATSTQNFDVEVRGVNHAVSKDITERIGEYMQETYTGLCILPTVPNVSNRIYSKCRILEIGNITNLGEDNEGKIVFRISAQITYQK